MFVIRRKIGQSFRIGEDTFVEVLEATPSRVKLGITAPASVRVVRSEVLLAEIENRQAAGAAPADVLVGLARQLREGRLVPSPPHGEDEPPPA